MSNNPIGILDSGVGGLTVWKQVVELLPNESTVYVADSKNIPYGDKSKGEIYLLAKILVEFLLRQKAKIIVIACNTITVSCIDRLRFEFPQTPIIGTVPVIKKAVSVTRNKKIGIFATTRTAKSNYQKDLINKYAQGCKIVSVGSDEIVPLIEQGEFDNRKIGDILQRVLQPFESACVDTICLGCTHFPFIEKEIKKVLGKDISLLEPSGAIARHTKNVLSQNNNLARKGNRTIKFYTTGDREQFIKVAKTLLKDTIQAEYLEL